MQQITFDPTTVLLALVVFAVVFALVAYRDRAKSIIGDTSGAIVSYVDDVLVLMIGVSAVAMIVLPLIGVGGIAFLQPESLAALSIAYAAARWGAKQ